MGGMLSSVWMRTGRCMCMRGIHMPQRKCLENIVFSTVFSWCAEMLTRRLYILQFGVSGWQKAWRAFYAASVVPSDADEDGLAARGIFRHAPATVRVTWTDCAYVVTRQASAWRAHHIICRAWHNVRGAFRLPFALRQRSAAPRVLRRSS